MKRGTKRKSAPEPEAIAAPACRRCGAPAVAACAYEDRRGTLCGTDWCAEHLVDFAGLTFCARHAGTVKALGEQGLDRGVIPETDNRIPSLLATIVAELDADIRQSLEQRRSGNAGEQLVESPISLITTRGRSVQRRWERTWKLASHTGISHAVSLGIAENAPLQVILKIDGHVLARAVPAWVAERGRGGMAAEDVQRDRFFGLLRTQVTSALPPLPGNQAAAPRRPWWTMPGLRRNAGS